MHRITTVRAGASSAHRTVTACPRRHEAVELDVCASCPYQSGYAGGRQMLCVTDREEPEHASAGTVGAVMQRDVLCGSPDLDAEDVTLLLASRRVGCLPIVDDEQRPIGIVSKSDLLGAYAARRLARTHLDDVDSLDVDDDRPPPARTARDLMSPAPVLLREADPIERAAEVFAARGIHRAPVVGAGGRLVGIITSLDLVRAFGDRAESTGEAP